MKQLCLILLILTGGCNFFFRIFFGEVLPPDAQGSGFCDVVPGFNGPLPLDAPTQEYICDNLLPLTFPCNCMEQPENEVPVTFPEGVFFEELTTRADTQFDGSIVFGDKIDGCKSTTHYAWPDCSLVAEVSGIAMVGGQRPLEFHESGDEDLALDEDFAISICPDKSTMRVSDGVALNFPAGPGTFKEIRSAGTWGESIENARGRIHIEVQGCRLFNGRWHIKDSLLPNEMTLLSRPQTRNKKAPPNDTLVEDGDLVSVSGDWIVDDPVVPESNGHTGYTEIHEARIYSVTRQPKGFDNPQNLPISYSMVSGFFTKSEASLQNRKLVLDIQVPPPPGDISKNDLFCNILSNESIVPLPLPPPFLGMVRASAKNSILDDPTDSIGCVTRDEDGNPIAISAGFTNDSIISVEPIKEFENIDGKITSVCRITIDDENIDSNAHQKFNCQGQCADRDFGNCPKFDEHCTNTSQEEIALQDCDQLAAAFVVRSQWIDPIDTWVCQCPCEDLSSDGATISAPIRGCASVNPNLSEEDQQQAACEAVCGGQFCGLDEPDCQVGQCTAPASGGTANLVSRGTCEPNQVVPSLRVSETGDYRVTLDPSLSFFALKRGENVLIDEFIKTGELFFTTRDGLIDFSSGTITANPFSLLRRDVEDGILINSLRMIGTFDGASFTIDPDLAFFAVAALIKIGVLGDFEPEHALFSNPTPITGTIDFSSGTFSMILTISVSEEGIGEKEDDEETFHLEVHLEGTIDNGPPVADASNTPSVVECSDHNNTPVLLDGTTSSDPDSGDSISHYQWFDDLGAGVGNSSTEMVILPVGDFNFELHVYDEKLGATQTTVPVTVQDTIPPELSVSPEQLCLWPPNHKNTVFHLGQELIATAEDICDASPSLRIISVTSDEPANGTGDGDTEFDVSFSDQAFCVRQERSGTGDGRTYTLTIEAQDFSGNTTQKPVSIFVPHQNQPGCNDRGQPIPDDAPCQ